MALRVAGLLVVVQSLEYLLGEACTVVKEQWKAISLCELSSYSELIVEGKINQVRQLGQLGMARQDYAYVGINCIFKGKELLTSPDEIYVTGFGPKDICWSEVQEGEEWIMFLGVNNHTDGTYYCKYRNGPESCTVAATPQVRKELAACQGHPQPRGDQCFV